MTSDRKKISNQQNAVKSTGPKTKAGKKNTSSNALRHGFYSRELRISPEDKADFDPLRNSLLVQLAPSTPLQTIAFEQIVASCWRCKLAIRLEMHRLTTLFTTSEEEVLDESRGHKDERALQWFGASYQDLNRGIAFLGELRADVAENGSLHLERSKEQIIKVFGIDFYGALDEWKPMSIDSILMAEHLVEHSKKFGASTSAPSQNTVDGKVAINPQNTEDSKVVIDPKQKIQMLVKLVDMQMQHLVGLRRILAQRAHVSEQAHTDFVPRYFTTASRDLQRTVDWYLYLKSKAL